MYYYGYGFNSYWLIFVMPAMLFSMWAQAKVNSTYRRYSQESTYSRMTGYEAARRILDAHGLYNVGIERIQGRLTDNFDPRSGVLHLSDDVYYGSSIASVGVAAHEAGHAVQHAENYLPVRVRMAIIPLCQLGSTLSWPVIIIGLVIGAYGLVDIGLALFSLIVVFQLVTLPVEFNASNRALASLEASASFNDRELDGAQKVLWAAGMTYVAALAVSVANLLRIMRMTGRRRR